MCQCTSHGAAKKNCQDSSTNNKKKDSNPLPRDHVTIVIIHQSIKSPRVVFASRKGEKIVRAEHIGQTAVVCDQSRDDAKVTSKLDNFNFLVKKACYVII